MSASAQRQSHRFVALAFSMAAVCGNPALATEEACGSLTDTTLGPITPNDYRNQRSLLKTVETFHFTSQVESLSRGKSSSLGGDINYTLHLYPNHPRALLAMSRLSERQKMDKPVDAAFTVECYYDRALRFRPDDHVVRMLYATFLMGKGRKAEARNHVDFVVGAAGDNPLTHANAGLLYLDLGDLDAARRQALTAQAAGHAHPVLIERLRKAGRWDDADAQAPTSSAAASSAAASAPR